MYDQIHIESFEGKQVEIIGGDRSFGDYEAQVVYMSKEDATKFARELGALKGSNNVAEFNNPDPAEGGEGLKVKHDGQKYIWQFWYWEDWELEEELNDQEFKGVLRDLVKAIKEI